MRKTYKIGEVANILGVSADTIRYYEKAGIVYSKKDRPTDTGTLPRRISTRCWTYCFTAAWTSPVEEVRNIVNSYQHRV